VEAKHLDYPPFKIDFFCATKYIPTFDADATTHYIEFEDVHGIIKKTNAFIAGLCNCYQSEESPKVAISEPHRQVEAMSNSDSVTTGKSIAGQWVPPLQQIIHHMIITTKSWGTPDTCEFPVHPDQAFLGNLGLQVELSHLPI
jgi:hypothetical protein